jgi:predicted XRE-type DNA-binding protein
MDVLEMVNSSPEFCDDIASNFTITLGDEFQGLLKSGQNLMKILTFIESRIYPIQVRFGIGIGNIQTEIYRYAALGADGAAYYRAREVIEQIKNSEKRNKSINSRIAVKSDAEDELLETQINTILALCSAIKSNYTIKQNQVINYLIQNDENQYQVANALNIKQPSINRTIRVTNYYLLKSAIEVVQKSIDQLLKNGGAK